MVFLVDDFSLIFELLEAARSVSLKQYDGGHVDKNLFGCNLQVFKN